MSKSPTRASAYLRLSRLAGETNVSLAGMSRDLHALATREGFDLVAEHVDNGISGAVRDRPEFAAWLDDARDGRADVLLTWSVDRLTREGLPVAALILDVVEGRDPAGKPSHKPVRLLDFHGLDSRHGESFRLRFVLQAELARAERERMSTRSQARAARLRHAGRWAGGFVHYGYRVVDAHGGGKTLDLDEHEAEGLRAAASLILEGRTPGHVARWLTANGYQPRRAKTWHRSSVIKALTDDAVVGRVVHKGQPVRDDDGRPLTPWPPVLDLATHRAVRAALAPKRPGPRAKGGRQPARLLSGLLVCGSCRRKLRLGKHTVTGWPYYRCATRSQGGECPAGASVGADRAEALLTDSFLSRYGDNPMVEVRNLATDDGALAAVEDHRAATLVDLAATPTQALFDRLAALHVQRDEIAARPVEAVRVIVETGRTTREEWDARDTAGRREMLDAALAAPVTVVPAHGRAQWDPGRLVITWPPSRDLDELLDKEGAVYVPPGASVAEVLAHGKRPARFGKARKAR